MTTAVDLPFPTTDAAGDPVRAVGIDPGATTGLVCLDLPTDLAGGLDWTRARWVDSAVVKASGSQKLSGAEQDASLFERIDRHLARWQPTLIVLEEPADAMSVWRGRGRDIKGHRRGTVFALGRAYGLALAAAQMQKRAGALFDRAVAIASYPVTTSRKMARLGWMQGRQPLPTRREDVLQRMRLLATTLADRGVALALGEDELMALGVLAFHVDEMRRPFIPARKGA